MNFRLRLLAATLTSVLAFFNAPPARAGLIVSRHQQRRQGGRRPARRRHLDLRWHVRDRPGRHVDDPPPGGITVDTYCVDLFDTTYVGNGGSNWSAEILPITSFTGNPPATRPAAMAGRSATSIPGSPASVADSVQGGRAPGRDLEGGVRRHREPRDWQFPVRRLVRPEFGPAPRLRPGDGRSRRLQRDPVERNATVLAATSHPNGLYQDLVGPGSIQPGFSPNVSAVPEPSSIVLVLSGLGGLALARCRRAVPRCLTGEDRARDRDGRPGPIGTAVSILISYLKEFRFGFQVSLKSEA